MMTGYDAYISSDNWHRNPARLGEFRLSGRRCRLCNSPRDLTGHHRTYARLGMERVSDITTLCRPCHEMVTDFLRRRRHTQRRLPEITPVPTPTTFDLVDSSARWRHVG